MIKIANNALENCQNVGQVVALINDEFATDATPEMVAASYAQSAAVDAGFDVTEENVEAHLNFLADFGAKFDFAVALKLALEA